MLNTQNKTFRTFFRISIATLALAAAGAQIHNILKAGQKHAQTIKPYQNQTTEHVISNLHFIRAKAEVQNSIKNDEKGNMVLDEPKRPD